MPVRVATIAALTALASSTLRNGQIAIVDSYAGSGVGGGLFQWHATSTSVTDFGVTFVPDNLTAAATTHTLEYGHYGNANGSNNLVHSGVVAGSVQIGYDDSGEILTDWWLHGHSVTPRHGVGGTVREDAILDHTNGKLWGDAYFRIRHVIATNDNSGGIALASRSAPMEYRYTTGAGRWIRRVEDYVTPAMFGGKPGDEAFCNANQICWALNWLNGQDRIKKLKYDGLYWVEKFWGEVYSNIGQEGQGQFNPCVKYKGDQNGSTQVSRTLNVTTTAQTAMASNGSRTKWRLFNSSDDTITYNLSGTAVHGAGGANIAVLTGGVASGTGTTALSIIHGGTGNLLVHIWEYTGVGGDGVADLLKDSYINVNWPTDVSNRDPRFLMGMAEPLQIKFDRAQNVHIHDFCVDGNYEKNLYFLGDTTGAWDTGASGRVSQRLRESPNQAGFFSTIQSGREIGTFTRVTMDRVYYGGLLGSCIVAFSGGEIGGTDVVLGPSVSGRCLYGGAGGFKGLRFEGLNGTPTFVRSSFCAMTQGVHHDVLVGPTTHNPWPENSVDIAYFALRGEPYPGAYDAALAVESDPVNIIGYEKYRKGHTSVSDFGIDMRGQAGGIVFRQTGGRYDISRGHIKTPLSGTATLLDQSAADQEGGDYGSTVRDVSVQNYSTHGVKLINSTTTGYLSKTQLANIHIVDGRDGSDVKLTYIAALATVQPAVAITLNMDPHPGGDVFPVDLQVIEILGVKDETWKERFCVAEGAAEATAVQTLVKIRDSEFFIRKNSWLVDGLGNAAPAATKLTFDIADSIFDTWDPGETGRGSDASISGWISLSKMRNVETHDGRKSECDFIVSYAIVAGTPGAGELQASVVNAAGYIDVNLGLLYKPVAYRVEPVSANARTVGITSYAPAYAVSTFNGAVSNTANPFMRITLPTVTAGQTLVYAIEAAVAP